MFPGHRHLESTRHFCQRQYTGFSFRLFTLVHVFGNAFNAPSNGSGGSDGVGYAAKPLTILYAVWVGLFVNNRKIIGVTHRN